MSRLLRIRTVDGKIADVPASELHLWGEHEVLQWPAACADIDWSQPPPVGTTAALVCSGPSVTRWVDRIAADVVIGVNEGAYVTQCDWWYMHDAGLMTEWSWPGVRVGIAGRVGRFRGHDCADLPHIAMRAVDTHAMGVRYNTTCPGAIWFAGVVLNCHQVQVYGADMSGGLHYSGRDHTGLHGYSDDRWTVERRQMIAAAQTAQVDLWRHYGDDDTERMWSIE